MPGQCPNVKEGGHPIARWGQLSTEARMNAGRNYEAVVVRQDKQSKIKFDYLREYLSILKYSLD